MSYFETAPYDTVTCKQNPPSCLQRLLATCHVLSMQRAPPGSLPRNTLLSLQHVNWSPQPAARQKAVLLSSTAGRCSPLFQNYFRVGEAGQEMSAQARPTSLSPRVFYGPTLILRRSPIAKKRKEARFLRRCQSRHGPGPSL